MSGKSIRRGPSRSKALMAVSVLAAAALGACIPVSYGPGFGGNPQPIADPGFSQPAAPVMTPASYVGARECTQRTGSNGGYGFWDIFQNRCYSCPSGFGRTIFDIHGNTACERGGPFGEHAYAEDLGAGGCPQGTIERGGSCYSCPGGTTLDTSNGAAMCR